MEKYQDQTKSLNFYQEYLQTSLQRHFKKEIKFEISVEKDHYYSVMEFLLNGKILKC